MLEVSIHASISFGCFASSCLFSWQSTKTLFCATADSICFQINKISLDIYEIPWLLSMLKSNLSCRVEIIDICLVSGLGALLFLNPVDFLKILLGYN